MTASSKGLKSQGMWRCGHDLDWEVARRAWAVLRRREKLEACMRGLGAAASLALCALFFFALWPSGAWAAWSNAASLALLATLCAGVIWLGQCLAELASLHWQQQAVLVLADFGRSWIELAKAWGMDNPQEGLVALERQAALRAVELAAQGLSPSGASGASALAKTISDIGLERRVLMIAQAPPPPAPKALGVQWRLIQWLCKPKGEPLDMDWMLDEGSSHELAKGAYPAFAAGEEARELIEAVSRSSRVSARARL